MRSNEALAFFATPATHATHATPATHATVSPLAVATVADRCTPLQRCNSLRVEEIGPNVALLRMWHPPAAALTRGRLPFGPKSFTTQAV